MVAQFLILHEEERNSVRQSDFLQFVAHKFCVVLFIYLSAKSDLLNDMHCLAFNGTWHIDHTKFYSCGSIKIIQVNHHCDWALIAR